MIRPVIYFSSSNHASFGVQLGHTLGREKEPHVGVYEYRGSPLLRTFSLVAAALHLLRSKMLTALPIILVQLLGSVLVAAESLPEITPAPVLARQALSSRLIGYASDDGSCK